MTEPDITINGAKLSMAQSMTLRIAATAFLTEMSQPVALGDDEHGRRMVKAYRERLVEIMKIMRLS